MKFPAFIGLFDRDVQLRDVALDPLVRPTRRMIANACLGVGVDDAYYAVRELREAAEAVHEGEPAGKAKLVRVLSNDGCDDFQRTVYYSLAGRGVVGMLDDLMWLEALLLARGEVTNDMLRDGKRLLPLVNPYVSEEPDGPVVSSETNFRQGSSWWSDPAV